MIQAEQDELSKVNAEIVSALADYKAIRGRLLELMSMQYTLMKSSSAMPAGGDEAPKTGP